jgi:uncharacterized protein (DUF1800 family)
MRQVVITVAAILFATIPVSAADALHNSGDWSRDKAAHLLRRAGFGGTPAQIDFLAGLGRDDAVKYLVDFERVAEEQIPLELQRYRGMVRGLRSMDRDARQKKRMALQQAGQLQFARVTRWWVETMVSSPRPLQEKLVVFWHGHFTSGFREVKSSSALYDQNQLFRRRAHGNFRDLLLDVTEDSAMILYLNTQQNRKRKPNENYARELLELFTMGAGNYTERDIKEAARAFTGISIDPDSGKAMYRSRQHDYGEKTFLGRKGDHEPADIIDIILEQPATAEFLARKFWAFFAYESPSDEIIRDLAGVLRKNKYDIKPMLTAMFASDEFYGERARFTHIKSPIELLVGTMRVLEIPPLDTEGMVVGLRSMGQMPMQPPNVKGWDGGATWITSSTLFNRFNVLGKVISGTSDAQTMRARERRVRRVRNVLASEGIDVGDESVSPAQPPFDPMPLVRASKVKSVDEFVDYLIDRLLQRGISAERRATLIDAVRPRLKKKLGDAKNAEAIRGLIHLIVSMPEYQLS